MNFAPKELSEKLQALGCKPQSGFYYVFADWIDGKEWIPVPSFYKYHDYSLNGDDYDVYAGLFYHRELITKLDPRKVVPAFIPQDFIGPSEQARENARILWGEGPSNQEVGDFCEVIWSPKTSTTPVWHLFFCIWKQKRHAMIDLPEDQFWVSLEKVVGER